MPWTGKSFAKRHNRKLKGKAASRAARQANAILSKTGDEGLAIAVANKNSMQHKDNYARDVLQVACEYQS